MGQDRTTDEKTHNVFERHMCLVMAMILALGLTAALGFLEFLTRLIYPSSSAMGFYETKTDGRAFGLKPGYCGRQVNIEYNVAVRINNFGLRDDRSLATILTAPRRHILFVGDSFTFGYGVDVQATETARLQMLLTNQGIPATCYSAGYDSGWGPVQFEFYLRKYYDLLQPNIIVLNLFMQNDLHDHEIIDQIHDATGRVIEQRLKGLKLVDGFLTRQEKIPSSIARTKLWLGTHSAIYKWFSNTKTRLLLDLERRRGNPAGQDIPYYFLEGEPRPKDRLYQECLESLVAIHELVRAKGGQLLVCMVPSNFQVAQHYLFAMAKYYCFSPQLMEQARTSGEPQRYLASFFDAHSIPWMDPLPDFRALEAKGQQLYFDYDAHWNEQGHMAVTKILLNWLTTHGWLTETSALPTTH
ncbi:hypothetical protein DSUL_20375 [Desulfovibrionales bacterium]